MLIISVRDLFIYAHRNTKVCHQSRKIFKNMKIKLITFLYLLCSTAIAVGNSKYGDGTGAIFMDELQCSGSESSLGDCQFDGYGQHDCDHTEDAGVICNAGEYL
jgi:hypothetical protein